MTGRVAFPIPKNGPAYAFTLDGLLLMQSYSWIYSDLGGLNQTRIDWDLKTNPFMRLVNGGIN